MNFSRATLLLLFAILTGCEHKTEPEEHQGILVSWLAETDKSHPCVVVANKADAQRLLAIGERDYSCKGRKKGIAHNASKAGLARILATLPPSPAPVESDSATYPWHVIRLEQDRDVRFRLSDAESQLLFKSIAEDSPLLRDEIEGRLIHEVITSANCSRIDRTLTSEQQAVYSRRVSDQLHPNSGAVLQSYRLGTWQILYVELKLSDPQFLFYSNEPLNSEVITMWGGAAAWFETNEIFDWVVKNAPGIPKELAQCFAWRAIHSKDM